MERKILDVFDNIHRLGVVHNDVRSENVLIAQSDGSVWVVDFEHAVTGDEVSCNTERQLVKEMIHEVRMRI